MLLLLFFFFLMIRRPPRSTLSSSSAASDVYKRQGLSPATSATLVLCCQRIMPGTHRRLPGSTRRKVGMTSSLHAPYVQGFTHATMAGTKGCKPAEVSESQKAGLSSEWGLQLDPMKSESLVIADQQRCGEYVPGPCTHRPSCLLYTSPSPRDS